MDLAATPMAFLALSTLPTETNHLGLSGTRKKRRRKMMLGPAITHCMVTQSVVT